VSTWKSDAPTPRCRSCGSTPTWRDCIRKADGGYTQRHLCRSFTTRFSDPTQRQRRKTASRLHNPRTDKITYHTFRHFKATMEYHRTKDALHLMQIPERRNINNTLRARLFCP